MIIRCFRYNIQGDFKYAINGILKRMFNKKGKSSLKSLR